MEKINNKLENYKEIVDSPKLNEYKSKIIDEIYSSAYIRKFLNDNNLDSSFVEDHFIELIEMAKSAKPCINCKGYLSCPNSPKGYVQTFNIEKDIVEYGICKKLTEIYPIKVKYGFKDFPEEWIFNSIDKLSSNSYVLKYFPKLTSIYSKKTNKGLYFYGPSGCGKSYILVSLCNSLIAQYHINVDFCNYRKLLDNLKSSFEDKDNYIQDTIYKLQNVDCLVIDDLGTEKVSEWSTYQVLFEILQERNRNKKLTFITSLYPLNELKKLYGGSNPKNDRLFDLIEIMMDEQKIEGINYNEI